MKELSETLLEDWAIKKLKGVGLTPDANATIGVREDESWTESGCETCGPWIDYYLVIQVNGRDTLQLGRPLGVFMNEILFGISNDVEYDMAQGLVEEAVRGN